MSECLVWKLSETWCVRFISYCTFSGFVLVRNFFFFFFFCCFFFFFFFLFGVDGKFLHCFKC
jgi:hypothetical protein